MRKGKRIAVTALVAVLAMQGTVYAATVTKVSASVSAEEKEGTALREEEAAKATTEETAGTTRERTADQNPCEQGGKRTHALCGSSGDRRLGVQYRHQFGLREKAGRGRPDYAERRILYLSPESEEQLSSLARTVLSRQVGRGPGSRAGTHFRGGKGCDLRGD